MTRVILPKILEYDFHPWTSSTLEVNGVQFTATTNSVNAAEETVISAICINALAIPANISSSASGAEPGGRGDLLETELGLTVELRNKAEATNTQVDGRWQARNLPPPDVTWVSICQANISRPAAVNGASNFTEYTYQGRLLPQTNFNKMPFEVRFLAQSNSASNAQGRVKSSSFVWTKYKMS